MIGRVRSSMSVFSDRRAKIILPCQVSDIKTALEFTRTNAYLVGGVIRDSLLGVETSDIDVAIEGNTTKIGKEIATFLNGTYVLLDMDRDISRVVVHGDRNFQIDLVSVKKGIHSNLEDRDFTINAMAIPLSHVNKSPEGMIFSLTDLIDPFEGASALKNSELRAVSSSAIKDDPLRAIRAVRLSTQYKLKIESITYNYILKNALLLKSVSPERIRDEFMICLSLPGATSTLRLLEQLNILREIIPELTLSKGVKQPKEHFWDVFNHSIESVGQLERILQPGYNSCSPHHEAGEFALPMIPKIDGMYDYFNSVIGDGYTRLAICKLACLLHDIAKPATKTTETDGRIRFLGHNSKGAELAELILKRLRFSGSSISLVCEQVRQHLRPSQMSPDNKLPSGKAIFRYFRDAGDAAIDTLYLNMADYMSARGPLLEQNEWESHCRTISYILKEGLAEKGPANMPRLITGHDIMDRLSIPPGPRIGQILMAVIEAQSEGKIANREQALTFIESASILGE